jgi:hypothetical protein
MITTLKHGSKQNRDVLFYLDSGATDHICNRKEFFHEFVPKTQIFTVPGGTATTEGIGTINLIVHNFQTGNDDKLTLKNVAYMPMSKNLISTGELNKKNLHVSTENHTLYSSTQVRGYKIQAAENLLVLPCSIINADVNVILSVINKKRKNELMAVTRTVPLPSEPEYQEDIKLDTSKFNELNNKFGPFKIELFA